MDSGDQGKRQVWTGRPIRPVIGLYVAAVFLVFMALAYFVFDSMDAVVALFFSAVGGLVALVPGMVSRIEYSLTENGLEKRNLTGHRSQEFTEVFSWEELSHVVPTASGFKYYKQMPATNPLRRFSRLHLSSHYSGEVYAEGPDRRRVLAGVEAKGVPTSRREARRRIESVGRP